MKENPHSTPTCPASGGLIRFQGRLTDLITWLGPAWACLCGVVASGGFGWQTKAWLRLALLILLVDGGWGTLWAALGSTDWATPLLRWRDWRSGDPVAPLPYTLPGSPGDRASRWLGQLRVWWRVTALLGALLGPELLLLSLGALAVMQLGMIWKGGRGDVAPGWDGIVTVMLPWLAGHIAFGGEPTLCSAGLALAFALAWGAAWRAGSPWGRALGIGAQLLAAVLLVALYYPLAAGLLLLLLAPQLALLPHLRRGQPVSWYTRYSRPWLMAAMLIAAWAL
jgi:hypothetical protein